MLHLMVLTTLSFFARLTIGVIYLWFYLEKVDYDGCVKLWSFCISISAFSKGLTLVNKHPWILLGL